MDGPDATPGTDRLASDRPDNFKIAARPDLPTPEWPNVLAGLGSSGLALRRVAFGRWQAGGQAGSLSSLTGKLLPCAACEYSWGHTLHVCASCPALPAGADLFPFRKPERELGPCAGPGGDGQTAVLSNQVGNGGRPFRDAGRERKVCAGICAHLFAVRTIPWFPVTSAVTSTVTLYCGTTAQHTAQGTCVDVSANLAAKPTPSFVSALLPNLK